jgi:DnaK suppressor protein
MEEPIVQLSHIGGFEFFILVFIREEGTMRRTEMQQTVDYFPSENEEYMNPNQLAYFEMKLRTWLKDLITVSVSGKNELKDNGLGVPDLCDVASAQRGIHIELEELKRQRGQISLIEKALGRIKNGSYGYCEVTGERIGLKRLEIQPIATLSVEAQEMLERAERGARYSQVQGGHFWQANRSMNF